MLSLLNATSLLGGITLAAATEIAARVTGSASSGPVPFGHSGLNYDGIPLQVCASIGLQGVRYRMLGDPASDVPDISERFVRSLRELDTLIPVTRAGKIEAALRDTIEILVGTGDRFDPLLHPDGVLWIGAPLSDPGIALYVDARNGGIDPATRLRTWLMGLVDSPVVAELLLGAVLAGRVMSAGIEGVAPGYARAKIYWRLASACALSDIPLPLFSDPAFATAVLEVIGDRELPLDSIVLSAGVDIPSGEFGDAKIDICCCPRCVRLDPGDAEHLICKLAETYQLPVPDLRQLLVAGELAFIGFGLTRNREPRINIYMKPFH